MSPRKVIVVSNRLPVSIIEGADKLALKRSIGGLATTMGSLLGRYPMLWIGWAGTSKKLSPNQLKKLRVPDTLVPIAISGRLFKRYYDRIANGMLWPILHGLKPSTLAQEADWDATRKVVTQFADAIVDNCGPDDLIWIHDYQLLLLPKVLRERGIENRIGFFLHTPFPSYQVLRKARYHKQLLHSLSCVDVLGFQTERDAAHFRSCLGAAKITMRARAKVGSYPIGIDYHSYRAASDLSQVVRYLKRLRDAKPKRQKLILSVSRLDYTKGIIEQLEAAAAAIEARLPEPTEYKLIVAPSRETVEAYQELKLAIDTKVEEINQYFSDKYHITPIDYSYHSFGFEQLNAYYRLADVLLVTPVIDGMNLVVKEYIAARRDFRGAVVLSKTVGAAFQLKEAVLVDPQDVADITRGITHALRMKSKERTQRWRALVQNVREEDVFWWARSFLTSLVIDRRDAAPEEVFADKS